MLGGSGGDSYVCRNEEDYDVMVKALWLEEKPYVPQTDTEFYKTVNELCSNWFGADLTVLSLERKIRIIPYIYRTSRTTIPQLARVFGLDRSRIASILGKV